MNYFALLRNPVDHVLSWVRYNYQVQSRGGTPLPGGREFSSRDLVAWLIDHSYGEPFRENMQTNFFALYGWCEMNGIPYHPAALHLWPEPLRAVYKRDRLAVAKDVLRSFLAVGTVERIIDSLDLLRRRSQIKGFFLAPSQAITLENVTRVRLDDAGWIGEHDAVGSRLFASLAEDAALYAFAQQLLDDAKQEVPAPSLLTA